MADKLSMSLDEIIEKDIKLFPPARRPRTSPYSWQRSVPELSSKSTVILTNLDGAVMNKDIQKLFSKFNPQDVAVHYDQSGRPLGSASVTFLTHTDAVKATKLYNGTFLYGQPILTYLIPKRGSTVAGGKERRFGNPSSFCRYSRVHQAARQQHKTAEELDAELEAYKKEGCINPQLKRAIPTDAESDAELDADLDDILNKIE